MIASTLPVVTLAALLCLESRVLAQPDGGFFDCTPSSWTYGTKVTIKLRIDRTKYPSECDGGIPNNKPRFQSSPDGVSAYTTKCIVADDIQTSCSFPAGTLGCGCTDSDDNGYFVIEYNFVASVTDERWWKIALDCVDAATLGPGLLFPECQDVPFMTTTVTPPTTTTPPKDHCSACECEGNCSTSVECIGCACGIAAFVLLLVGCILLVVYWYTKKD